MEHPVQYCLFIVHLPTIVTFSLSVTAFSHTWMDTKQEQNNKKQERCH